MKPSTQKWIGVGATICAAAIGALTLALPTPGVEHPEEAMAPWAEAVAAPEPTARAPAPAPVQPPAADPEKQLFAQAQAQLDADPDLAIELLQQGDAQFPSGPLAHERQFLKLKARVNLNEIPEARVDATNYLEHNPRSPIAPRIHRLLGIHPPPGPFPTGP